MTTTLQRLLGLGGLSGEVATHGGANRRNMLLLIQLRWLAVAGQAATILMVEYVMGIPCRCCGCWPRRSGWCWSI